MAEKKGLENCNTLQDYVYADLQDTIGGNLLRLRNEKGLTRSALSRMSEVSPETLYCLEKGVKTKKASIKTCRKLAAAYGMSLETFVKEILKGQEKPVVSGENILTADLSRMFPYNLVKVVYGEEIPYRRVSIAGVLDAIDLLSEKEQKIIICLYEEHMTPAQVGKQLGKTRSAVCQIEAKALRKLRQPYMRKRIEVVPASEVEKLTESIQKLEKENYELQGILSGVRRALLKGNTGPAANDDIGDDESIPIENLGLSSRAFNCLKRNGINTVADLVRMTADELCELRNFGSTSLGEVKGALASQGMSLKKEDQRSASA